MLVINKYLILLHSYDVIFIGKRWEFVWGEGSKDYSEKVIKSYICRHGSVVRNRMDNQQLSLPNLAAIHAGGSANNRNRTNIQFGRKVADLTFDSKFGLFTTYHTDS